MPCFASLGRNSVSRNYLETEEVVTSFFHCLQMIREFNRYKYTFVMKLNYKINIIGVTDSQLSVCLLYSPVSFHLLLFNLIGSSLIAFV